jgi:hypothetical protein
MQQVKNINKTDKHSIDKTFPLCTFHNHWCMPTQAHLLWIDNLLLYTSNLCHNTKPIEVILTFVIYSWLSLSRIRLTRISGWVEFLSKSRTSLCINIYNLTPVESNSDDCTHLTCVRIPSQFKYIFSMFLSVV